MIRANKPLLFLAGSALAFTAACDPAADDGYRNARQGAMIGGILGATVGAITNDDAAEGALKGGILGAGVGGVGGSILDKQENDLRRSMGNDTQITNTGDRLIVTLPQDILFATDSATLRPDLQSDLRALAANLRNYSNSTVQVIGHTDNTGDAGYNQQLSTRRASSVANVLINEGVGSSRIVTAGRGEDQPVASNLTPSGRAQNRRVEIVILPNS